MTTIRSRRRFLGATAAAAALGSTPLGFASGEKPKRKRDIALVNGRIHTLDAHDTIVDSLLIREGRFAKVGGVRHVGDDAEVINLRGRTVIPGVIDNHVHFIRIGNAVGHDERRLETAFTIPAAQALIRARAAGVPEGEFITALAGIVSVRIAERRHHAGVALQRRIDLDDVVVPSAREDEEENGSEDGRGGKPLRKAHPRILNQG
jgi:Amidohydrolase family